MAAPRSPDLASLLTFGAMLAAASRASRRKGARPTVARFRLALADHLLAMREAVLAGRWRPGTPRSFAFFDPKPRTITVLPFADRVLHQCLAPALEAATQRRMIADCFACRRDAGTHAAMRRARAWSRTWRYALHLDVGRYFPRIDRAIVEAQLRRDHRDPALLALCLRILHAEGGRERARHLPGDDLFSPLARSVGLPLGNLTSQHWANRYLDPVDHLVKDGLRVRGYLRYMDDMLIFGDDPRALAAVGRAIEEACHGLHLRLHPWAVRPTADGVGFVGYRFYGGYSRVRRSTVARAERRLAGLVLAVETGGASPQELGDSLRSTFGHWSHADTWRLKVRTLRRLQLLYEPW